MTLPREPDDKLSFRQRLRNYGPFTPPALAMAMELAHRLPVPEDAHIAGTRQRSRPGVVRKSFDFPPGVLWRLQELARARGISVNRLAVEMLCYYVIAVGDSEIDLTPGLYADFQTQEGIQVLREAFTAALAPVLAPVAQRLEPAMQRVVEESEGKPMRRFMRPVREEAPLTEEQIKELQDW